MELLSDVVSDCINIAYQEVKKDNNKRRLKFIINKIKKMIFKEIEPYLYAIIAILIIMISMNVFQFYYYTKLHRY